MHSRLLLEQIGVGLHLLGAFDVPPEQRGTRDSCCSAPAAASELVCVLAAQGLGFKDADKLHTLKRPVGGRGPSTHEGQAALN